MASLDQLFRDAAVLGLQLGKLAQYTYTLSGETRNNHWEAHFHDAKGKGYQGAGRTPAQAVQAALPTPDLDFLD
jgi:hypothetical protein